MGNFTQEVSMNDRTFEVEIDYSICKGDYLTPDMADQDIVSVTEILEDGTEVDVTKKLSSDMLGNLEQEACEKYFN